MDQITNSVLIQLRRNFEAALISRSLEVNKFKSMLTDSDNNDLAALVSTLCSSGVIEFVESALFTRIITQSEAKSIFELFPDVDFNPDCDIAIDELSKTISMQIDNKEVDSCQPLAKLTDQVTSPHFMESLFGPGQSFSDLPLERL